MEVLLLLVFVSLTLALGAMLCFVYSVRQGDAEQAERLSLMPLETEKPSPSTARPAGAGSHRRGPT
jgi:nitrogen fixation-related uncharacterized protein